MQQYVDKSMGQTSLKNLLLQVPGLLKGLAVRDQTGKVLGKIIVLGQTGFELQSGIWKRRYYYLDYNEIISAFHGSIYIFGGYDSLRILPRKLQSFELDRLVQEKAISITLHALAA